MLTHNITLESKEFGILAGQILTVRYPENLADCALLVEKGDSDIVARFSESIVRAQNNLARSTVKTILKAEKDPVKALAALQAKIGGYRYTERIPGESAPKGPKTPKAKQNAAAASSGNRLFERCLADETMLARMVKQNIVDQAEFDAWKTARTEAAIEAAKPKAPKAAATAAK